jgi:hypothetical protein
MTADKKIYVCFLTTGRYSDTHFQVTKVFKDESDAKQYVDIINERNKKCWRLEDQYRRNPEKRIAFENPSYSKHKQVDIERVRDELESKKQKIIDEYKPKIMEVYGQFLIDKEAYEIDEIEGLIAGYTERELLE